MEHRIGWELALATLSLTFALSLLIAWVYSLTHNGLSYTRSFAQGIALCGIITAAVMMAIGDEIARGLGVVGALTMVRFRTTLKDARDLTFIFAALGAGVACGVQSFVVAIAGTGVFMLGVFFVAKTAFGSRRLHDAVLRLRMPTATDASEAVSAILKAKCRRFTLISMRQLGTDAVEHSYQLELRDQQARPELLRQLDGVPGAAGVTLLMQDAVVEP